MASLYEIDQEIMQCLDMETGEIIDPERLNALQMERNSKIENVALWIKNLQADANAYKAEKDAFAEREKKALAKIDSLKKWLAMACDGQKFNTWRCAVAFRKSEKVEIFDETKIPQELLKATCVVTPDKAAIKEALKAGEIIEGCALVTSMNPTIK